MNQMLCNVSGIQNKEQKTQIKNSLNKIDGVREVGVNLATGIRNNFVQHTLYEVIRNVGTQQLIYYPIGQ